LSGFEDMKRRADETEAAAATNRTELASLQADDGIAHSLWLSLMRDRLELIHKLLSHDGSLWITIDDNEAHYLKILCDEIFGRNNFIATIIWEKRTSRENRRVFSFNHDYILVFARDKAAFEEIRNPVELSQDVLDRYKNPDNDPRGPWQSVSANAQAGHATPSQFYKLRLPSGREIEPPKGRCWLYTKQRLEEEIAAGNIWFGADGDNTPRIKKFLKESDDKGMTPETIWPASEVGTNDDAKKALLELLDQASVFDNPKPESLIRRVLHIATNPGEWVLDSFLGSGTGASTAATISSRDGNKLVTAGLAATAGAAAATNSIAGSAFNGGQGNSLINALAHQNERFSGRRGSNGESSPRFGKDDLSGAKAVKSLLGGARNPGSPNSGS
jgi:adenine-specific DNA-methyltransferase